MHGSPVLTAAEGDFSWATVFWWLVFLALMITIVMLYRWAMHRDEESGAHTPFWRGYRL